MVGVFFSFKTYKVKFNRGFGQQKNPSKFVFLSGKKGNFDLPPFVEPTITRFKAFCTHSPLVIIIKLTRLAAFELVRKTEC